MNPEQFRAAAEKIVGLPPNNSIDGWTLETSSGYLLVTAYKAKQDHSLFLEFADGARPGLGENPHSGAWHIRAEQFNDDPEAVLKELARRLARAGYEPPRQTHELDDELRLAEVYAEQIEDASTRFAVESLCNLVRRILSKLQQP